MSASHGEDFWQWSLDHYGRKGVEPVLLHLQDDFDFNINITLWCCWCASRYESAPEFVLRQAIEATSTWNANVTGPLRSVRRYLKTQPAENTESTQSFRNFIKEAELSAEKEEQSRLEALAVAILSPLDASADPRPQARRNLAAYTALIGAAKKHRFTISALETLIDHIFAPLTPANQE